MPTPHLSAANDRDPDLPARRPAGGFIRGLRGVHSSRHESPRSQPRHRARDGSRHAFYVRLVVAFVEGDTHDAFQAFFSAGTQSLFVFVGRSWIARKWPFRIAVCFLRRQRFGTQIDRLTGVTGHHPHLLPDHLARERLGAHTMDAHGILPV